MSDLEGSSASQPRGYVYGTLGPFSPDVVRLYNKESTAQLLMLWSMFTGREDANTDSM